MPQELTQAIRGHLEWLGDLPQVQATFQIAGAPFAFVLIGALEGDPKTLSGWRIYKGYPPDPTEEPSVSGNDEDFTAELHLERCDRIEVDNAGMTASAAGHSVRIVAYTDNSDDD